MKLREIKVNNLIEEAKREWGGKQLPFQIMQQIQNKVPKQFEEGVNYDAYFQEEKIELAR